jgi:F-type H+-transporting ATPase subunit b
MFEVLILAAEEHAEHAPIVPGSTAQAIAPALTALIVFSLLLIVLWRTVWPKIVQGLDDRDRKIREEIKAAEEAREKARAALAEYERSLAQAREEANKMIAKARADAKAVAEEMRAQNAAELTEKMARANREIDSAKHAAISELHAQAGTLAAAIAGKILQREISVEDQQRLVEESLRELASARNN